MVIDIKMCRFDAVPWGFSLVGGADFEYPLTVVKVRIYISTHQTMKTEMHPSSIPPTTSNLIRFGYEHHPNNRETLLSGIVAFIHTYTPELAHTLTSTPIARYTHLS